MQAASAIKGEVDLVMGLALGGAGGVAYCYAMGGSTDMASLAQCGATGAIGGFVLDYLNEMTGDYIPLIDQTTMIGSVASGFVASAILAYARGRM